MSNKAGVQSDIKHLLERVRRTLPDVEVAEKRMFGGVTLMLNGNMLCCVSSKGLMVRVGKDAEPQALQLPDARPCDGTGHKMPGFILIGLGGLSQDNNLEAAVNLALRYVAQLPPKVMQPKAPARRPRLVQHRP